MLGDAVLTVFTLGVVSGDVVLTAFALIVLAASCGAAVLSPRFDDTLIQRVALAGMCIGAMSCAVWVWDANYVPEGGVMLALSGAVFALETVRKIVKRICRGAWREY
jgi:hypothetical protein